MKEPFESIVARHGAVVLRVARAVVGPVDAQDAWSETFLAALRAYPRLSNDANVEAWLVTIAHRKSIDIIRARSRQPIPVDPQASRTLASRTLASESLTADPMNSHPLTSPPADSDIWPEVALLPEKQRQSIAYHYLVGLPFAEVAVIMGGTPEAARKAASAGIARLRTTLPRKEYQL